MEAVVVAAVFVAIFIVAAVVTGLGVFAWASKVTVGDTGDS